MDIDLSTADQIYLWHPFTQMPQRKEPLLIVKGEGSFLYTQEGTPYLDAISSWWVNLHGHAHPYIIRAVERQLATLPHTMLGSCTHPPAILLAKRLLSLTYKDREKGKVFYSDNGSTAVETALKMALQYEYNRNPSTKRKRVVSFKGGYHGDTFGSMAVSGKTHFNRPFWDHLFGIDQIEVPYTKEKETVACRQLEEILDKEETACFIFEPLAIGAGGMHFYSAERLDRLIRLCKERGVLTIADEVMTGFGRLGPLFACDVLEEKPDFFCLSKGITGGFLPLGATVCRQKICDAFVSLDREKTFLHGHTYGGNPLACASALASLDLLEKESTTKAREEIAKEHHLFCQKWQGEERFARCESKGTILTLEYRTKDPSYFSSLGDHLSDFFLKKEILLRPLGQIVYFLPPYCITKEELHFVYDAIIASLEVVS